MSIPRIARTRGAATIGLRHAAACTERDEPTGDRARALYLPALALLPLLVPLAFDPRGLNPFTTIKDAMLPVGSSVAALLFLADIVRGRPRAGAARTGNSAARAPVGLRLTLPALALAFGFWSVIAPTWSATNPALHFRGAIHLSAYLVVFALAACAAAQDGSSARGTNLVTGAITLSALAMALHACLQALGSDPLYLIAGAIRESGRWRVFTTTGNPDWTAEYLAAAAPLAAWVLDRRRSRLGLWAWVLAGAAILATGSRLGLCALLAGGAWYAVALRKARKNVAVGSASHTRRKRAIAIIAAVAVAVAYASGHWGVPGVAARWLDGGSVGGRWILARSAWTLALEHPVRGNGLGHFAPLAPEGLARVIPTLGPYWQHAMPRRLADHVHDDLLEAAFEGGLPAAALLLAMMLSALALSWRLTRDHVHRVLPCDDQVRLETVPLPAALGAALLALLVEAAGSAPLHTPATALLFWTVSGLLAGCTWGMPAARAHRRDDARGPDRRLTRAVAAALLPCALAAAAVVANDGARAVHANRLAATASAMAAAGRPLEARYAYRHAVRLAPWDVESRVGLAALALERGDPFAALAWAHGAQAWAASRAAWAIEASAWERLGRPDRAIASLVNLLGALPDDRAARRRLLRLVVRAAERSQPRVAVSAPGAPLTPAVPPRSSR